MASDASISGKTCLVTGATSGIGLVTARDLARRGHTVLIVGRSKDRCATTAASISRDTNNPRVIPLSADLSSQADTRRLATTIRSNHPRLDILINNAGALFELRQDSTDGVEMTMALNHLGYFLLTNLLLSHLNPSARIVIVSSTAHKDVPGFDFNDPEARERAPWRGRYPTTKGQSLRYALAAPWAHPAFLQYAHSKLANLLFTLELSRRLAGTNITVNALHPCLVATGFAASQGPYTWFMSKVIRLFGRTPEQGAQTIIYLATSPDVEGRTSGYYVDCRLTESAPAAKDETAARRLWDWSAQRTGL